MKQLEALEEIATALREQRRILYELLWYTHWEDEEEREDVEFAFQNLKQTRILLNRIITRRRKKNGT